MSVHNDYRMAEQYRREALASDTSPRASFFATLAADSRIAALYALLDDRLPEPDEDDGELDWRAIAAYACEKALGASDEDAFRTAQDEAARERASVNARSVLTAMQADPNHPRRQLRGLADRADEELP